MKKTVLHYYKHLCHGHKPKYIAIFLILLANNTLAQTDTTKILKEVNVRSSATPQLQTVTPTQTVTSADFIKNSSFNVADAIRNFAGVNIRDYGGIGGLKTVSVRSLGANHTAVLYDGIQLNDAQNGQIDLSKFNLNNIQSITLYVAQPAEICMPARSFAAATVLAINTVKPQLTPEKPYKIVAGIKGGSFGLFNPYVQWQQRISNNWSFVVNSYLQKANGRYKFKENNDGSDTLAIRTNSDVNTHQVDGGLYWAKTDSNKFNLQVNYYHSDRGLPGPNILYTSYLGQRLFNRDIFIQSGYEHIAKNSLHLLINTKVSQNYLRYINPTTPNSSGGIDENYTQREFYQSAALSYEILPRWEVSYASDVAVSHVKTDIYNFVVPTRLSLYNVLATDVNFGKLHVQVNLLNTYVKENVETGQAAKSRSAFTPTVMVTVKPFQDNNIAFRAFYKSIFRYPTLAEQYYYAIAPRNIRPEYVKQYNLGVVYSKSFNGVLNYISFTADGYYNKVKDKIIFLPVRSPATPSVINLGSVDIRGVDVNLKTKLEPVYSWQSIVSVSYTYQKAINVTSKNDSYYRDQIPYTPKHSAAINAGVTHKAFGFYYNQTFSSYRYDSYNNEPLYYLPNYSISDAAVTYSFSLKKLPVMASAEVNNLFNKNYEVIKSYPMPGRSLRLTFQITI